MTPPRLYLASRSPRRQELLAQLGLYPDCVHPQVDETPGKDESPLAYVQRLAREKAWAGWALLTETTPAVVLGADTSVILQGQILGKPQDREHALAMLRALAGQTHHVISAVALTNGQREDCRTQQSQVRFRSLSEAQLQRYWETGEPRDKAGGYAIQGLGAVFVQELHGSYSGVMGLPLFETAELLEDFSIPTL